MPMNLGDNSILEIYHSFHCPIGSFPIKYLGVSLYIFVKLSREEIQPLSFLGEWQAICL
jgi:hypothetical protein